MRGDVLYLRLEDSDSRIQTRLLDITDDTPPNLFFATMSKKLRGGLEQQIERFLKELADWHRIAILLVHHLRKMDDDDPMNMISGTTGISSATDSNFVLRKDKRLIRCRDERRHAKLRLKPTAPVTAGSCIWLL